MTPKILKNIYGVMDMSNKLHMVLWTALLTGFLLLLRKSNLVPNTQNCFNPKKQLTRKRVTLCKDCVVITITWSKTIQSNQRKLKFKLLKMKDSVLCPVRAYEKMFKNIMADPDQPCFQLDTGLPLSYNMLQYHLKKFLFKVGKNPKKFGSHSLRRGGLSWGNRLGIDKKLLKLYGDWRSSCFERYLAYPYRSRKTVAKKFRDSLKHF